MVTGLYPCSSCDSIRPSGFAIARTPNHDDEAHVQPLELPHETVLWSQGSADLAVSQAIGSNVFNILAALGLPYCIVLAAKDATIKVCTCCSVDDAPHHCQQHMLTDCSKEMCSTCTAAPRASDRVDAALAGGHARLVAECWHFARCPCRICGRHCWRTLAHHQMWRLRLDRQLWSICGVADFECVGFRLV